MDSLCDDKIHFKEITYSLCLRQIYEDQKRFQILLLKRKLILKANSLSISFYLNIINYNIVNNYLFLYLKSLYCCCLSDGIKNKLKTISFVRAAKIAALFFYNQGNILHNIFVKKSITSNEIFDVSTQYDFSLSGSM